MWAYSQASGGLSRDGKVVATGYSGCGAGKNNPSSEHIHDVGPIPRGLYAIGEPQETVTHGPFVLPLAPDAGNQMFGRTWFLIHGDSVVHPGWASEGCIVLPRAARNQIAASGDRKLTVTV